MTRPTIRAAFTALVHSRIAPMNTDSVRTSPDTDSAGVISSQSDTPARHCFEIADAEFERDMARRYRNAEGQI